MLEEIYEYSYDNSIKKIKTHVNLVLLIRNKNSVASS